MLTTSPSLWVFLHFSVEASGVALAVYVITWRIVRGSGAQRVHVGRWWHVAGFLATMFGTGAVRFLSIFIIGGKAMMELSSNRGLGLFFPVAVPTLLAIGICHLLKNTAARSPNAKVAKVSTDAEPNAAVQTNAARGQDEREVPQIADGAPAESGRSVFCDQCGARLPAGANFCTACGARRAN